MLVEKKSLRRFLFVYILSSLFLLSIGTSLYYKINNQLIINTNLTTMKKYIDKFIETNKKSYFLFNHTTPDYLDSYLAIYINKNFVVGNFKVSNQDIFTKESFLDSDRLYFIHKEHKKWGEVYFVTYKNIQKERCKLQFSIALFFIFSTLFIIFISFILGKIFLKPMKNTIESLENFITDATHEINTPISNILINIEFIREFYPEYKNIEEFKKIETSALRISQIFKDLSFLKLEHNQEKIFYL